MADYELISDPTETRQMPIIVCLAVTWAAGAVFICLRSYTRVVLVLLFVLEDWFIILGFLGATGFTASAFAQVYYGMGKHILDLDPAAAPFTNRAGCSGSLSYTLALLFTKLSTLMLYNHIFERRYYRRLSTALMVVVGVTASYSIAMCVTVCIPVKALWDCDNVPGCQGPQMWHGSLGMHIITDVLIVLLPMPVVVMLKCSLRQKLILVAIFLLGILVSIASAMRMHSILTINHPDFTYYGVRIFYFTAIEVNLAVICPCAMTLRPLVSKYMPSAFRSVKSTGAASGGHSRAVDPAFFRADKGITKETTIVQHVWDRSSDDGSERIILQHMPSSDAPGSCRPGEDSFQRRGSS